jgi:N-acyl-L-homoserine lactone synthetase
MPIRIKVAKSPSELDGLFKTRHAVFVDEESYLKARPNKMIFDKYDTFPTTSNVVAMVNNKCVGGLRVTEWSEGGLPSDEFFDFGPYLPGKEMKIASASMLCLQRKYRNIPRLCFMMLSMGVFWAISREITHVVAAINPVIEPLVRSIGFKPIGPVFHDKNQGVDVLPTLLELKRIDSNFLNMIRFQGFHGSLKTFDRELYRAGEKIIEESSGGDSAYVIIDGRVRVCRPGRRVDDPPAYIFSELGPCEMFGELTLLTGKPRTADVIAMTDVDLMVIEKDIFWEQLKSNQDLQLKLLEMLGNRLADTVERVSMASFQAAGNWV